MALNIDRIRELAQQPDDDIPPLTEQMASDVVRILGTEESKQTKRFVA